jgi:antitoxin component YwqK of YwqJK toxin-antitoxin module
LVFSKVIKLLFNVLTSLLLIFGFLFNLLDLETGYFFFGNTNLIGVGLLEDNEKVGEWKVYTKHKPEENPESSLLRVDPKVFDEKYDQTKPVFTLNFKADVPDGIFQQFYPTGQIKRLANYSIGEFEGEYFEYWENGELSVSGNFQSGKKNGEWKEFYPGGAEKLVMEYSMDTLDGSVKTFFPNGIVEASIPYRRGKIDGEYSLFFSDGSIKEKGAYREGVLDGPFSDYYEGGKTRSFGFFINDKASGEWKFWNEEGALETVGNYRVGEKVGEWTEKDDLYPKYSRKGEYVADKKERVWQLLDERGIILQEEIYQSDKLISLSAFRLNGVELPDKNVSKGKGKRIYYDENGNKIASGSISKGIRSGLWYHYFPNSGKVFSKGRYQGNEKIGTWEFYTESGEIKEIKSFDKVDDSISGDFVADSPYRYKTPDFGSAQREFQERMLSIQNNPSSQLLK